MKIFEQVFRRDQKAAIEIPDHMVVMVGLYHIAKNVLGLLQVHEEVKVEVDKKFIVTNYGDIVTLRPEVTISAKRWTITGRRFVPMMKYKIDSTESIYVSGKIARCSDLIDNEVFHAAA